MDHIRSWAAWGALALAAACGGGGSSDYNPPSGEGTPISVSLVATGETGTALPASSQMQVITTQAAWEPVRARIAGSVPAALQTPDFTQVSLVYVEAPADRDPMSIVRVIEAQRQPQGSSLFTIEFCRGPETAPVARAPFALYVVARIEGGVVFSTTFAARPNCAGAMAVATTLVSSGDYLASGQIIPTIIRNRADLDALIAALPGTVPPAFLAPDFSQVNLVVISGPGDNRTGAYVRILTMLRERDGSHDVLVEFCRDYSPVVNHVIFAPFAIYTVVPIAGEVRVGALSHRPDVEGCATAR